MMTFNSTLDDSALNSRSLPTHCLVPDRSVRDLHDQLQVCQRRLGTPAESPDDLDRARSLAHQLNNWLQIAYLREQLHAAN